MAKVTIEKIKKLRAQTSAGIALCKESLIASDGNMEKAMKYVNERSDVISRLHNETGARIILCKVAFERAKKDFQKAIDIINEEGWADANSIQKCADEPSEGLIEAYVHGTDQKIVALVEMTTNTDFVANHELTRTFAHEAALHVAALHPKYVSRETIPAEKFEAVKKLFAQELKIEGKPEDMHEKIIKGKLEEFYKENCLLEMVWLKDDSKTVNDKLIELIGQTGEPITIRRILCWKFGE